MALTCPHLPSSSGTDVDQPPALRVPWADRGWTGQAVCGPEGEVSSLGPGRMLTPETAGSIYGSC